MNIKNLKVFILSIGLFGILFSLKVQAMDKGQATEDDMMESEIYGGASMIESEIIKSDIDDRLIKRFDNLNLNNENVEFSVEEAINYILNYKDKNGILSEIKKSDIGGLERLIYRLGESLKCDEEKEIRYNFVNGVIKPCKLCLKLKLNNDGKILVTKIEIGLSDEDIFDYKYRTFEDIFDGKYRTFDDFEVIEGKEDFMDFD